MLVMIERRGYGTSVLRKSLCMCVVHGTPHARTHARRIALAVQRSVEACIAPLPLRFASFRSFQWVGPSKVTVQYVVVVSRRNPCFSNTFEVRKSFAD